MENYTNGRTEEDEVERIIREQLTDEFCTSFVEVEKDVWMPEVFLNFSKPIKQFEIFNSDVIVASYPKSGTTWTQEMVWLIANDLNFKAAEESLNTRFPHLEFSGLFDHGKMEKIMNMKRPDEVIKSIEFTKAQGCPRFIKTHLPFSLLPDQIRNGSKSPKIIYVTRNPKDTCVSYYHHGRLLRRWKPTLEDFAKVFLAGKTSYGSFWKHVFGYWEQRNSPNFLVIKFEDMKSDLPAVIKKVAAFLEKDLTSKQVDLLCNHLSFESMKNNNAVNHSDRVELRKKLKLVAQDIQDVQFMRSGTVGKYKEELSNKTIERFDAWIKENVEGTDFGLYYNFSL